jgi:F0F1-type ATP synthase epsilon subunit
VLLSIDDALKVRVRLADKAWISIYPYHAPLLAEIMPGALQYETESEAGEIELGAGILRVSDNEVKVLTRGELRGAREAMPGEEEQRFDRLTRQLMLSLGAQPQSEAPSGEKG